MRRSFLLLITAAALFMAAVLLLDGDGLPRQLALGIATAVFVWFFARSAGVDKRQVLTACIVATLGEVVLSLGWGLYSYRHALIPLYVPPGHGLFYALAAATAHQAGVRAHGEKIVRGVMIIGTAIALFGLVAMRDQWGFLWWLGALGLMRVSRNQLMLASCFVYTILLEWAGTAIGNWQWAAVVPGVGLSSANPPAGVGILYILLDLIVMGITAIDLATINPWKTTSSYRSAD
ncbi:MAG TPA: hypothetical protein VJ276_10955 [Thermoanaerobaculia bacterium]|nr:hypothetical protein [Thermoanaerobaculia bacterium]